MEPDAIFLNKRGIYWVLNVKNPILAFSKQTHKNKSENVKIISNLDKSGEIR